MLHEVEDTIVNKSHQLPIEFEDYTKFLESTDKVSANQSSGLDGTNQGASTRNTIINVKASISQLPVNNYYIILHFLTFSILLDYFSKGLLPCCFGSYHD